jgi:hypothetical protein
MKRIHPLLLAIPFAAFFVTVLTSCSEERKGPGEKIGEAIDDATDSRPAEGLRDTVEDIKDGTN